MLHSVTLKIAHDGELFIYNFSLSWMSLASLFLFLLWCLHACDITCGKGSESISRTQPAVDILFSFYNRVSCMIIGNSVYPLKVCTLFICLSLLLIPYPLLTTVKIGDVVKSFPQKAWSNTKATYSRMVLFCSRLPRPE